jgi:hypothetical protein
MGRGRRCVMRERGKVAGWCRGVAAVLGAPFWPGRWIYGARTYVDGRGVERTQLTALCPACGKWVDVDWRDTIVDHTLPAGSDQHRADKRKFAEDEYGALVAADRLATVA